MYHLMFTLGFLLVGCMPQDRTPTPGFLPETSGSTLPIREIWCQNTASPVSYPTAFNGLVYTIQDKEGDREKMLVVVYNSDGHLRWQQKVASLGTPGFWFVQDGFLVTGTNASITVLDAQSGEILWQNNIFTNRGMTVGDEKVFVSTYGFIWALDISNGEVVWEIPGPGRSAAQAPYYSPENNFLLLDQSTYRIVDASTGEIFYETGRTFNLQEPSNVNEGVINQGKYLRVRPLRLEVLNPMTAEILHAFEGRYNPLDQYPFVQDGIAYLNSYWAVEVIDIERQERVWRHEFSRDFEEDGLKVYGGPVLYQDAVYVILSDASIRALDRQSGEEIGKWQGRQVERRWGIGTPIIPGFAIGGDLLYVSFGTHELCAFGK